MYLIDMIFSDKNRIVKTISSPSSTTRTIAKIYYDYSDDDDRRGFDKNHLAPTRSSCSSFALRWPPSCVPVGDRCRCHL
jgi:hypothetical protein